MQTSYAMKILFAVIFLHLVFICSCKDLKVRLVGGNSRLEGNVRVYYKGEWRSVCDDHWDKRDAKVVCRQLGFQRAINATIKSKFASNQTKNSTSYWLDDLYCYGHEKNLGHCWSRTIGIHNCEYKEEAGVICTNKTDPGRLKPIPSRASGKVSPLKLRLIGSDVKGYIQHGFLEVFHSGRWGAVCADGWGDEDAYVACGNLGYPNSKKRPQTPSIKYKSVPYFWMTKFRCNGLESTLLECEHSGWGPHKCIKRTPVYLRCQKSPMFRDDQIDLASIQAHHIRLRGGFRFSEGRVEVFHDSVWGTICDDNWDLVDANVACRQAGFGTAFEAVRDAAIGAGTGRTWMDELNCTGHESDIRKCPHGGWRKSDCGHNEDAGVRCHHPHAQEPEFRLVGGKNKMIGRVEVKIRKNWYGVCGIGFSNTAAEVLCRELGLGYAKRAFTSDEFGYAKKIAMSSIRCSGDENSLKDCYHAGFFHGGCRYFDMASVECSDTAPDIVMDYAYLQKSFKLSKPYLTQLVCAHDEGCLTGSADFYMNYYPESHTRRLLQFSARFWNRGTTAFEPDVKKSDWQWHSCHAHFHSMERFADFDLLDSKRFKVAQGHKASFCLEDSECDTGTKQFYNCTNKGNQGISVGCADNYKNNIDCQWIDITDVSNGEYTIRVNVNPTRNVPESDYSNNAAFCRVKFNSTTVEASDCSIEPCERRAHSGNSNGNCCVFPFVYKKNIYHGCTTVGFTKFWCSTTSDYDKDKKWGLC